MTIKQLRKALGVEGNGFNDELPIRVQAVTDQYNTVDLGSISDVQFDEKTNELVLTVDA